MKKIEVLDEESIIPKELEELDIIEFYNDLPLKISGKKEKIIVEFDNSLTSTVIDRFGNDFIIIEQKEDSFVIVASDISINSLAGWLFTLGEKFKVIYPEKLKKELFSKANSILKRYTY